MCSCTAVIAAMRPCRSALVSDGMFCMRISDCTDCRLFFTRWWVSRNSSLLSSSAAASSLCRRNPLLTSRTIHKDAIARAIAVGTERPSSQSVFGQNSW